MNTDPPFPTMLVIRCTIIGVVAFAVGAYAFSTHEFLTTPHFAGLYPGSTQDLRGWLAYPSSVSWSLVFGGIPGAIVGFVAGVVIGGFRARTEA